ncbi:MAG: hypothetical protein MMC33_010548 [Icmadophila ericetorum]|nr:hypothetical protein [Icmadophila ericetorum]
MKSLHSIGSGLCEVLSASSTHSATPTFYTARAKDEEKEKDMDNEEWTDAEGDGLGIVMMSSGASRESLAGEAQLKLESQASEHCPSTSDAPPTMDSALETATALEPSSDTGLRRQRKSRRSSKHSSQSSIPPRRIPLLTSSSAYSYTQSRHNTDPYLVHRRGKHLFSSLEGTLASFHAPSTEFREPLIAASSSSSPKVPPSTMTNSSYPPSQDHEKSEPLPCTTIDWTQPSTRRREYAEIDASHRGLKGMWRSLTPRWCQGQQRMNFYDEQTNRSDSDCGSVRRYRLDLPDEKEQSRVREKEVTLGTKRSGSLWSCFGSSKGKGEDEE